jgi:lysophospholipase L1-like esterase
MKYPKIVFCAVLCWAFAACIATKPTYTVDYALNRFETTILDYEKQNQAKGIDSGKIVFYGSSSWLKWTQMQKNLAPYPVLNRGFGGSTIPELLYYFDRVLLPLAPKAVFIYGGENDIASKNIKTGQQMFASFVKLAQMFKKAMPATQIYFVSMKLSPSRRAFWPELAKGNKLVKAYAKKKNIGFVDINPLLLDASGRIRPELYTKDSLHINQAGYDLYAEHLKPILAKIK